MSDNQLDCKRWIRWRMISAGLDAAALRLPGTQHRQRSETTRSEPGFRALLTEDGTQQIDLARA